jgi:ACS family tartrate transporter-like MFS transporter
MVASLCPFVLRNRQADAAWLTRPEREWLEGELQSERDVAVGANLGMMRAIISPQLLMLTIVSLLGGCGFYSKTFFPPLILKTFGFTDIAVGYWMVLPNTAGIIGMLLFSRSSDRTGERVWHLVTPMLIGSFGLILVFRHFRFAAGVLEPADGISERRGRRRRHRLHQLGRQFFRLHRAATRRAIA